MKPHRFFVSLTLEMFLAAMPFGATASIYAQGKIPETTATSQDAIARLQERLEAIEAKLRSLESRLDDMQRDRADEPEKSAGPQSGPAATPGANAVVVQKATIEEHFEALDQKLRIIERRRELEQETAAEKLKETAIVFAGKDGFSMTSADKNFQLKFDAYLQADSRLFVGQPSPALETFQIGRARPVFQGTIFKYFDFRIMPDFAGGQTVLQDLHLEFNYFPAAKFRFGKTKSPLGLEVLQGDTDLTFVARALPSLLLPVRDVGAQVFGDLRGGALSYAFGVFNGVPDGTSSDMDSNDGKDIIGRIFAHPFKNGSVEVLKGLGVGIGGSTGKQLGSLPSFKTSGQAVFFTYNSGIMAGGERHRFSPQAYYYWGSFGLLTEYAYSSQEVKKAAGLGAVQNRGWQVAASYALGGKPSYRAVLPKKSFNPKVGGLGAFEFTTRYSNLRVDKEAFSSGYADITKSAKQASAFVLGLNWYMARMVKFVVNYEQTRFQGGSLQGNRPTEHTILSRFQIGF